MSIRRRAVARFSLESISSLPTIALFFLIWTLYAFVSGVVAVPYNDIVARSIPSDRRSRMLALRVFGGGLLALAVAYIAQRMFAALAFPDSYAAVLLLGTALLFISAVFFLSIGEPVEPPASRIGHNFAGFLRGGLQVLRDDRHFRLFVGAQWLGGASALALPFYVLIAELSASDVAMLLGAQTTGALLSNPLWGWWGGSTRQAQPARNHRSVRRRGAAPRAGLDRWP